MGGSSFAPPSPFPWSERGKAQGDLFGEPRREDSESAKQIFFIYKRKKKDKCFLRGGRCFSLISRREEESRWHFLPGTFGGDTTGFVRGGEKGRRSEDTTVVATRRNACHSSCQRRGAQTRTKPYCEQPVDTVLCISPLIKDLESNISRRRSAPSR